MPNNFKSNFRSIILTGSLFLTSSVLADVGKARVNKVDQLLKQHAKTKVESKSSLDFSILKSKYSSWGIDPMNRISSINLHPAWQKFKEKKTVVVAVIDTGIDPYHPFLKDNIHVPKGTVGDSNYGVDFSKGRLSDSRPYDDHGHGTHVSGILKSVFPKVKILPLKYYNRNASGKENLDSTIAALRYAVEQNVDIINYSSGGPKPDRAELQILKEAQAKGILVVAAAGNEESNIDDKTNAFYPASYELSNVITVTAHDKNLRVLSSSNYGKKSVDIAAPGYRITSALQSRRAGELTGTSQATAFVSGVAAMIKAQYPRLTNTQIIKAIRESAKKEFTLYTKCSTGGRLDAAGAQEIARQMVTNQSPIRNVASKSKTKKPGKIIYRVQ